VSVSAADIAAAREAIAAVARVTPVLPSATLSELLHADVVLKAEALQRTGSFKVRGTTNKVRALGDACANGVVAASAGNHAMALAHSARALGVRCVVFMPEQAPLTKVEGARALGAVVELGGDSVDACIALARVHAERESMSLVHPFDDPDVVAGQGTLGLELLDEIDDLAKVVVPVGGGGLAAGVAIAVRSAKPEVEVVGVRIERQTLTIADGIAIKEPGEVTRPLLDEWLHDTVVVGEDQTAEAMVLLMDKAKIVVEGAGAVGVAALLARRTQPAPRGTTAVVLSGGNVDAGLLAELGRRQETQAGRRLVLLSRISDQPGSLATLLALVAGTGANLIEVQHVREGLDLHVRETAVELVLGTRGRDHAEDVLRAIGAAGYETRVLR
jgi:threonine dehydratase